LHPKDKSSVYITYSKSSNAGAQTTLATATYKNQTLDNFRDLFVSDSATNTGRHFGSRIVFDQDDFVYFSIGDRGDRANGQDLTTHAGSILRLNSDGTIPKDNPFVKQASAQAAIWSYGHRNPQGMVFDPVTSQIWAIEHGPRGGDEINKIEKGHNYGWPVTSHGKEYWGPIDVADSQHKQGITSPSLVYIPSIAPAGMILYRGNRYPELNGRLLAGALKLTHINVVNINEEHLKEERRLFEDLKERIRDITVSPDDFIYFTTDSGKVYRIIPAS
jgi:glucose/arabinose dehydrogenase